MTNVLWPTIRKFNHFLKWFHAVLYTALENHVPLPRFPETFSMWYRIVFGTKWHRFHYCCNLWWVQPLYCINTLDYKRRFNSQVYMFFFQQFVSANSNGTINAPHYWPFVWEESTVHWWFLLKRPVMQKVCTYIYVIGRQEAAVLGTSPSPWSVTRHWNAFLSVWPSAIWITTQKYLRISVGFNKQGT